MRSCTGLYLHGDVILQQKLEKQGGYILSRVIYARLSTTMQPCHIYVGRMKVRCGTTLPQTSRQAYVLAAKSTHNSKGNFHQANNFWVKQHMYLTECLQNHLLFYTDVLPIKGKPEMPNGFNNMALFMLWSQKIRCSNTIIFQVTLYDNVVYKQLHPLIFCGRILHFFL